MSDLSSNQYGELPDLQDESMRPLYRAATDFVKHYLACKNVPPGAVDMFWAGAEWKRLQSETKAPPECEFPGCHGEHDTDSTHCKATCFVQGETKRCEREPNHGGEHTVQRRNTTPFRWHSPEKMSAHHMLVVPLSHPLSSHQDVVINRPLPEQNICEIPSILFDGYSVLQMLPAKARARTSPENVSDVLDALVRILRNQPPEKASGEPPFELPFHHDLCDAEDIEDCHGYEWVEGGVRGKCPCKCHTENGNE